ncbi:MAG: glycosyltransferase [Moorellales bacterium]
MVPRNYIEVRLGSLLPLSYTRLPDRFIGWLPSGVTAGVRLIRKYSVRAIYSSSGPVASSLIACVLNAVSGRPWIAEFRDLWSQNHLETRKPPIQSVEEALERLVIRRARTIVTVSEPLAEVLRTLHRRRRVVVIPNGYDENDYTERVSLTAAFTLTYTGNIYTGKRDPSPLFRAIARLDQEGSISPVSFQVRFYGSQLGNVSQLVHKYGVNRYVLIGGHLPYREGIRRQIESSALLLLEWDHPSAKGVLTGKLFEYLGAKRPIIALAAKGGAIHKLLDETGAGVVSNDPDELYNILRNWYLQWLRGDQTLGVQYKVDRLLAYERSRQAQALAEELDLCLTGSPR